MGMYTEIFFRAAVSDDVVPFLSLWKSSYLGGIDIPESEIPDHEFFKCDRWENLMGNNDSYFPMVNGSVFRPWSAGGTNSWYVLGLHTSIKNYDSEYEKFFDWIDPYVMELEEAFIGYTLYEESNTPTLYRCSGEGFRKRYGRHE